MSGNALLYNKILFGDIDFFTMSEFRCGCKKCLNKGFPAHVNPKLVVYLDQLRKHFGKPVFVTSGLRCKSYNSSLKGSSKNSAHLKGCAADIYISGTNPLEIVKYWKSLNIGYSYCGTPNMGNAAHVQIGW